MTQLKFYLKHFKWLSLFTLASVIVSCGHKNTVLGPVGNPVVPPVVVSTSPTNDLLVVPVHNPVVTARFNQPIALDDSARFVITCASPCSSPNGAVTVDASRHLVRFSPAVNLEAYTLYTATIQGAKGLDSHIPMAAPYIWRFTTGIAPLALSVTGVTPAANTIGVALNNTEVTASFSEAVVAFSSTSSADSPSFALTCAAPCVNPVGTLSQDNVDHNLIYTLAAGSTFAPLSLYTATLKGVTSAATGAPLAAPVVWQFTTGTTRDETRPSVQRTLPATTTPGPTPSVPTNMAIGAVFSEPMAPASITAASFTLTCTAPCVNPSGQVSYSAPSTMALFTPASALTANTLYTASITTAVVDLAGNAMASQYVWTFTTSSAAQAAEISVGSTSPITSASNVCPNSVINASFNVPSGLTLDPASINSQTFTLTEAAPALKPVVAAALTLDTASGKIASFTPATPLINGTRYTATLKGGSQGIKDLAIAANLMGNDYQWSFTAQACSANAIQIPLGAAATFGAFGGSAGTTNAGIFTLINGNLGTTAASTLVTGFHDGGAGCVYTETPLNIGAVNGNIFTAAPPPSVACPTEGTAQTAAVATQARADTLIAYNALVALAAGPDPGAGNLANLVLAPGVYTAALGSFMIQGGNLTLDAQGDANAVWVFQMASTLTVGGPGVATPQSIILVNGAQAKNVFWQVGTAATINAGGGGTMVGSIIAQAGAALSTQGNVAVVTLNGRVLSLNASVTLVNTVINVPAP